MRSFRGRTLRLDQCLTPMSIRKTYRPRPALSLRRPPPPPLEQRAQRSGMSPEFELHACRRSVTGFVPADSHTDEACPLGHGLRRQVVGVRP